MKLKILSAYVVSLTLSSSTFSLPANFSLPAIEHWTTGNGVRVYYVQTPEIPMVDIEVVFDAGSARDAARRGQAALTVSLLNEGANGLSADQIAEKFESLGAIYSIDVGRDMATVNLRSLTEPELLSSALDMLAGVLAKPDFPEGAFARLQQQTLAGLQYEQQSPDDIGERLFYATLYGQHPYASQPNGTLESVKALTRANIVAFHQQYYTAQNAIVAIVGAVDRAVAEKVAEQVTAKLPVGEVAPSLPPLGAPVQYEPVHVPHPSNQTHILLGQAGTKRHDPDYFALYVGNHILGGSGLNSLISKEVREKRGLAYSAYSYFLPLRVEGPFMGGLQTRNEQAEQALAVIRETIVQFIQQGPTEGQLDAAKQNITGSFPLRIDSNSDIVNYLAVIGFYQLPLNYMDTFNHQVEAVTADMIKDAFQRRIHVDKFVTVTVGG